LSPLGDGQVRVSLRSRGRLDAGAVALALGGGGHRGAAGCRLGGSLAEVRAVIVAALGAALGQAPGPGDPS
jgi:phosphoesterase RecJ-like protein